jgi:hypothetical protein
VSGIQFYFNPSFNNTDEPLSFTNKDETSLLESLGIVKIQATQKTSIQIVPNNQYNYKSKSVMKCFRRRSLKYRLKKATELSLKYVNGSNRKQKPSGLSIDEQAFGEDVYVIDSNYDIYITNKMKATSKQLLISVRYLNNKNEIVKKFVDDARGLAKTWQKRGHTASRSVIRGSMMHFGILRGAGNQPYFSFCRTKHNINGANGWHKEANIAAKFIAKRLFPGTFNSIRSTMKFNEMFIPVKIGGKHGLCSEMIQSQHALVTEPHVDIDCSKCLSIWTTESGKEKKTDGWYFVLPYLTCKVNQKQYKGVAVRLRHCTAIEWDGRHVFHCSTAPNDKSINVHGTYFGMTHRSM